MRGSLSARPESPAEHRDRLRAVGCRRRQVATDDEHGGAVHVRRRGVGGRPLHPTGASGPRRGGAVHRHSHAHGALGPLGRPPRRTRRRPRNGIDCVTAGSRGREGRQEGVLGPALADVDPAEARPRLHRAGEVALRACSVRQEGLPNTAVAAQRVEHRGDRERQRKDAGVQGHRPASTRVDGGRRRVAAQADPRSPVRLQATGVRDRTICRR